MVSLRKSRQPFLSLRILLTISTIFFAVRSILSQSFELNGILTMFSLGLLFAVQGIEMIATNNKRCVLWLILTSVILISTGVINLWVLQRY